MTHQQSVPVWFWLVAGLALVWNLLGLMAFIADVSQSPEQLAAQGAVIEQLYNERPIWALAAFGIAVIAAVVACILLLLRKAVSAPVFLVSLLAVLVQQFYSFGLANMHEVMGSEVLLMPALVLIVAIALVWFSRWCRARHWIS